jgi:hypothetical protein
LLIELPIVGARRMIPRAVERADFEIFIGAN